jgi:ABC-2 type transport system ATP-binding protein
MSRAPRVLLAAALAASTAGLAVLSASTSSYAAGAVTKKTLHFDVVVGPKNDTHCDIIGDLYTPAGASKAHPVPSILTTNGFGGSKDDQAGAGQAFAARGYAVLSYSGLGFGGSGCKITLDDRDYDGKAGSQLLDFLAGAKAAKDGTKVDYVIQDNVASDGKHYASDPRVGMIGGSYGGQIQFAVAGVDPRLDTIVPIITWNDLSYSLAPNNTSFTTGVSYATPGVEKFDWVSLFFGVGIEDGIQGATIDPSRDVGCPNFDNRACPAKVEMDTAGYPTASTLAFARHASVGSYLDKIRIPTMLMQGEADTLFNLQEAAATYRALRTRKVPVKLVFQSWGHSNSTPQAGEFDLSSPDANYEGRLVVAWFDRYLKRHATSTGPGFEYFRDWAYTKPNAAAAYATSASYPVGGTIPLYISGTSSLVDSLGSVTGGTSTFTTPVAAPASYSETSALQGNVPESIGQPRDTPGTFAGFSTKPLARDLDVVGSPTVTLHLSAPSAAVSQAGGPAGMLVLFAKIYDVSPDGSIDLVHRLISPMRIPDVTKPVRVELPGVVHRFAKGHRLELVVAGSDAAYTNNRAEHVVSITGGGSAPSQLLLPVVSTSAAEQAVHGTDGTGSTANGSGLGTGTGTGTGSATGSGSGSGLASTGLGSWWPLAALLAMAGAFALRRRRA